MDRRGSGNKRDRWPFYCSTCMTTTIMRWTFDEKSGKWGWQCLGDQRGPTRHPGCGNFYFDVHRDDPGTQSGVQ